MTDNPVWLKIGAKVRSKKSEDKEYLATAMAAGAAYIKLPEKVKVDMSEPEPDQVYTVKRINPFVPFIELEEFPPHDGAIRGWPVSDFEEADLDG